MLASNQSMSVSPWVPVRMGGSVGGLTGGDPTLERAVVSAWVIISCIRWIRAKTVGSATGDARCGDCISGVWIVSVSSYCPPSRKLPES